MEFVTTVVDFDFSFRRKAVDYAFENRAVILRSKALNVYIRGYIELKDGKCEFTVQIREIFVKLISCGIQLVL